MGVIYKNVCSCVHVVCLRVSCLCGVCVVLCGVPWALLCLRVFVNVCVYSWVSSVLASGRLYGGCLPVWLHANMLANVHFCTTLFSLSVCGITCGCLCVWALLRLCPFTLVCLRVGACVKLCLCESVFNPSVKGPKSFRNIPNGAWKPCAHGKQKTWLGRELK